MSGHRARAALIAVVLGAIAGAGAGTAQAAPTTVVFSGPGAHTFAAE